MDNVHNLSCFLLVLYIFWLFIRLGSRVLFINWAKCLCAIVFPLPFFVKILYGINECKKKITVFLNFSELRIVNIVGSFFCVRCALLFYNAVTCTNVVYLFSAYLMSYVLESVDIPVPHAPAIPWIASAPEVGVEGAVTGSALAPGIHFLDSATFLMKWVFLLPMRYPRCGRLEDLDSKKTPIKPICCKAAGFWKRTDLPISWPCP